MRVLRNLKVPTGNILVCKGNHGKLEVVSLADYGQDINLNQNKPVVDGTPLQPLSEKWVVTISTQYGCSMGCKFCDVPKVGPGRNAAYEELRDQISAGLLCHPEVIKTKRLNIHYARMGEPTWNRDVLILSQDLHSLMHDKIDCEVIHPVVSTMMPRKNTLLLPYLKEWMSIKNNIFKGDAGLQLSINSTSDSEREVMFNGNSHTLDEISSIGNLIPFPSGRKITLNFAVADYEIDAKKLRSLFDPSKFICKLTPMHKTTEAIASGISTGGDYTTPFPYEHHADNLREEGFDVLTFIASREEDLGRITCGNAILSGTMPHKFIELSV